MPDPDPGWITESRVALIIAGLSAAFTAGSLIYTRTLARNDTKRMRRKPPLFEPEFREDDKVPPGWRLCVVSMRNLEPASVCLDGIRARKPSQMLCKRSDAFTEQRNPWNEPETLKDHIPGAREISVKRKLHPAGSDPGPHGAGPSASSYVLILTKGVTDLSDLTPKWTWLDGYKP